MEKIKYIYFIGIGGIGMSAIARYFNAQDYVVSGYDKTETKLTQALAAEGIAIHYEDNTDCIPKSIEETLVVYTPAIPADLNELVYVKSMGYDVVKRSKILGRLTSGHNCFAVAGTHGKTSTSTLLAHIFHHGGEEVSAFLGGISKNLESNLLISGTENIVVEADEYDRSFLQLHPQMAVITSMDPDHLDIYSQAEAFRDAFNEFGSQVENRLIVKYGLPIDKDRIKADILTYAYDDSRADFYSTNVNRDDLGRYHFDLVHPQGVIKDCHCGVPGWVNVENSVAASAIALSYGIDQEKIKEALASFNGVQRRFDIRVNTPTCTYIDDYAHHPKELKAAISTIRGIFPGRKFTGIFQPHLFSRTRDFADGFAESLSLLDKVILLDIYPAREKPIEGISSLTILDKIEGIEKILLKKEELIDYLMTEKLDILATFGAGDIDRFVEPITKLLKK